jgi:protein pelota
MKKLSQSLSKDSSGSLKLMAQEPEDMWHLYNLIAVGDALCCSTFRKVVSSSTTGSTTAQKVRLVLEIRIETIEFDVQTQTIRIGGPNEKENEHVKMGQYHTMEVAMHRAFTLSKPCWDRMFLDRVAQACNPATSAEVAAVVMQQGIANVCLITQHMTLVRQKIDVSVPRKRMGSTTRHDKAVVRFYDAICDAVKRHVDFKVVKCVIFASPGFVKDDVAKHLFARALREGGDWKEITENKSKFILCHSSSGFKHALREAMQDPGVQAKIADTKAFDDTRALDQFFEMFNHDGEWSGVCCVVYDQCFF